MQFKIYNLGKVTRKQLKLFMVLMVILSQKCQLEEKNIQEYSKILIFVAINGMLYYYAGTLYDVIDYES